MRTKKVVYPPNFEAKTGFDRIRQMLTELCLGPLGRQKVNDIAFTCNFGLINRMLDETNEFRQILLLENNFPASWFLDLTTCLKRLRIEGTFISTEELFDLMRSLDTVKGIANFFKACSDEGKYPTLQEQARTIKVSPVLLDKISNIIDRQGRIRDNASPTLASIRRELMQKQASVSKRMHAILKTAQSAGIADTDAQLSIRNGRLVIPVNSSNKRKIRGLVHDESATGKTSFIEPEEIVETNNEIRELEYAEHREIVKILSAFTDQLRPYIPELLDAYDFLGTIDLIRAKAQLALKIDAGRPALVNEPLIRWYNATHPLLYLAHKPEGKEVVPLDIELNPNKRILVISGPNAGGKSVCLKTTGLLQYMLQCGLLVPMKESSEAGIFSQIFIDIGDEQSIENDLSTYSSHLLAMKHFCRHAGKTTLLLIDEFGAGTEPTMGGAIAEAILTQINNVEAFGVITTHYANLKQFASNTPGVFNGAMQFDSVKIQPLFKLEMGKPGSSFAFEIARKIGLSEEILKQAADLVGSDYINFDKQLKMVARDKRYWEQKRDKIKHTDRHLDELVEKYTSELEAFEKQRKELLQKARAEARELVAGANRQVENTIRTIKEANAEKERTREARKELDNLKEKLDHTPETDDQVNHKIEQLKQREARKKQKQGQLPEAKLPEETVVPEEEGLKKGDKVRIDEGDTIGEVVEVGEKQVFVSIGSMITSLPHKRVEKISQNEYKKITKDQPYQGFRNKGIDVGNRKLNFKPQIDVRGMRVEEALQKVSEFIDEAILVEVSEVRILHGKGFGILRQAIRDLLQTIPVVESVKDEQIEFGGAGISIVRLG